MWTSVLSFAIVINELMASNAGTVMSPATNFDSWIELYNPTEQTINLSGMYLSDDENNLKRWQMPNDIGSIPAKGYLVVWLGSNDIKSNQAPFKLDCDGGTIILSDKNGNIITSQTYPEAMSRTSWARTTDGGDEWGWTADATPGQSNATATFADERMEAPIVSVGSKLFNGTLNVKVNIPEGATLMYTTDGSLPTAPEPDDPNQEEQSPWIEFIRNGNCEGNDATCLISRDADGNGDEERIIDGVGYNNSRGIKVHSIANASNDWDAQLFVYTPDHVWQSGEKYRFRMKVRADKNARITAQTHSTPHNYISGTILNGSYNVTTQWQEITYEGEITDQQTGSGFDWWSGQATPGSMQTIAFNLNVDKKDNNYYFDDISWELWAEDFTEAPNPSMKSTDGQFTVSNTTNYTFRLFKDGYLPSVPVTRSYIKTSNNYTLPVISIVGDKSFFTDPKIGFDCDGDGTNGVTGNGQNSPKNYNQNWERPVNFSYISSDGEMLHNQDVNIKVSGGYTRTQRYRSFKLKASKVFDGQNRYDYPFFPQKPYMRSKTLLVRNGGNDIWRHNARFIDPALETIIQRSGIDVDVQSYVPTIEYVNGELRGVLNLREPNNDDFAYANWGYDDDEIDAFENLEMKDGDDVAINRIFELAAKINDEGAYDELKSLLDIDEYTNYMAVTLFLYNDDWPDNNIKAYRSRNDGRYRFVSFDLDYAFKGCWGNAAENPSDDNPFTNFAKFKDDNGPKRNGHPVVYNKEFVNLFLNLLSHDGYRRKFIDTFCLMGGSVFEPTRATAIVDELLNNVKGMCQLMFQQGINDGHEPDRAATTIKDNLSGRSKKMADYLKAFSYAKLSNSPQAVTLKADTEGARLFVNGIEVPYTDFNGHLFAPVELTATPPAGYAFAGWKKGSAIYSSNETIQLPADKNLTLTATFTPQSSITPQPVRINEVSAANGIYVNEFFKRNDWVELYNTTNAPVDVEGMYLSDNPEKPEKYQIAKTDGVSTVIPSHGYLIIWCDKLEPKSQLHAPFKLAAEGDELMLTAADGSWTDHFTYPAHNSDQTVGRYPDGSDQVWVMNIPTIAKANITSSYVIEAIQNSSDGIYDMVANTTSGISLRYVADRLVVQKETGINDRSSCMVNCELSNLAGQTVQVQSINLSSGYAEVPLNGLSSGYYIARLNGVGSHTITLKFMKK
ncbi:MAG: lamin tail domain-containing protein [Prevotella sp.]|nr:lamin tail domain-containing protein [Prevotella sp.]